MKNFVAMAAAAVFTLALVPSVSAQTLEAQAGALAGATSASQSASLSASQGGSVTFNSPSQVNTRASGSTTVKTAPALGGLALGGGHPCALAPVTGQISIIGGGIGAGGMVVDDECMAMIKAATSGDNRYLTAANIMAASHSPETCRAYYQAGLVSECLDKQGRSILRDRKTVSSNSGGTSAAIEVKTLFTKCSYDKAANKVTFSSKSSRDRDVAKAQCMASLGF